MFTNFFFCFIIFSTNSGIYVSTSLHNSPIKIKIPWKEFPDRSRNS